MCKSVKGTTWSHALNKAVTQRPTQKLKRLVEESEGAELSDRQNSTSLNILAAGRTRGNQPMREFQLLTGASDQLIRKTGICDKRGEGGGKEGGKQNLHQDVTNGIN